MSVFMVRCLDCETEWDIDAEPTRCTCSDGGRWQLRVDDGPWENGYADGV